MLRLLLGRTWPQTSCSWRTGCCRTRWGWQRGRSTSTLFWRCRQLNESENIERNVSVLFQKSQKVINFICNCNFVQLIFFFFFFFFFENKNFDRSRARARVRNKTWTLVHPQMSRVRNNYWTFFHRCLRCGINTGLSCGINPGLFQLNYLILQLNVRSKMFKNEMKSF